MERIKLAIVDDRPEIRESLHQIFSLFDEVEICWMAKDGEEAIWEVEKDLSIPDVILMDIEMRVINGIEATKRIKSIKPQITIVVLSVVRDESLVKQAILAGADGYLLKDEKPLKMLELVKYALEGRFPLSPEIARQTVDRLRTADNPQKSPQDYHLTKREKEVLMHLVAGKTYQQIAEELLVSPLTIRSHMENLYRKLSVNSKAEAVALAVKNGWH
jgi:DNA-binding NarL/FixJ family response regulator